MGCGFQSFVSIVMKHNDKPTMSEFERQVAELPQIVEAHRLFGEPDYLLRVAVEDIAAFERFYAETLAALPGIAQLTSHLTMKVIKPDDGYPTEVK
jgi:Lrp/AsnC family transcriptional regulator, leucine-responsive regulatory protein